MLKQFKQKDTGEAAAHLAPFFSVMSCRDITLGKAILVLLMLAHWKETLDIASWVFDTVTVVETD